MPYIKKEDREKYDAEIDSIISKLSEQNSDSVKGHHNYIMFTLALKLARERGIRYHTLQDIMGTFECCKEEFYRRIVAPYEDNAIMRNGDIE